MKNSHVCILGLGYIGLPTAAILTKHGLSVTGVDPDQTKATMISAGQSPFDEDGLGPLIADATLKKRLTIATSPPAADIYIICVPTPFKAQDNKNTQLPHPDLSFVEQAIASISSIAPDGALIILESTSPVGTTNHMAQLFAQAGRDASIGVSSLPRSVNAGQARLITDAPTTSSAPGRTDHDQRPDDNARHDAEQQGDDRRHC